MTAITPPAPLERKLLALARDRLCTLMGWLRESEPPVTPAAAVSILSDAIRLHSLVLGEGTEADVAWLLDLRFDKAVRTDPETKREKWSRCVLCQDAALTFEQRQAKTARIARGDRE